MTFYSELQTTSDSLLTKFGRVVTVRRERTDTSEANPWEGKTAVVSTYTGYAVLDTRKPKYDGTTITRRDTMIAYISPVAATGTFFTPEIKDYVTIGSDTYKIVGVEVVSPSTTELLYIVDLEK